MNLLSHCSWGRLWVAVVDEAGSREVGAVVIPLSEQSPDVDQRCRLGVAPVQDAVEVL